MNVVQILGVLATVLGLAGPMVGQTQPHQEGSRNVNADRPIVELRQYTLHPNQRDILINLFESNFVEGQEATGIWVIGQFRDLDNPDRFVWLRSFPDMLARAKSLDAFYSGPIWQTHRGTANPTMVDSDNVLLLHPVRPQSMFPRDNAALPPRDARGPGKGLVVGHIVYLRATTASPGSFSDFFDAKVVPELMRVGDKIVAELETEESPNTFLRLPIREGEHVFVWFSVYADEAAYERHQRVLAESATWRDIAGQFSLWTYQPVQTLRLEPTARSRIHGA